MGNGNDFTSILGNSVIIKVVQEFIADPDEPYSISYMHELTDSSKPAVRDAFNVLLRSKLIYKANKNDKRPLFKIDRKSERFIALTLLLYAILDDVNKSNLMGKAINECIIDNNANLKLDDESKKIF
jgi:hypothetical protein